jgi:glycine betaine/proline transport system permease protein
VGDVIQEAVGWLLAHAQPIFDTITLVIGWLTRTLNDLLLSLPIWLLTTVFALLAAWRVSWRFSVFVLAAFALVAGMDLWQPTASTLALVLSSTLFSLFVGLPLGVLGAKSDLCHRAMRPVLDLMQTMPAFVYLIPAAMFFGLGKVPGTIATIIFATPPAVRLTSLGIRQVPKEIVEAGRAFGCTETQLLFKVQLPSAMPSIMAGVNQNIMLALSMVVIASMIGAGGLGNEVLRGIQRMDIGLGFEGGIGVVLLAIILDRITQSFGERRRQNIPNRLRSLLARMRGRQV